MISAPGYSAVFRRRAAAAMRRHGGWRAHIVAVILLVLMPGASFAADILRGSVGVGSTVRWDGLVLGAQLGLTNLNTDFGGSTSSLIAYVLRNTEVEDQYAPSNWTTLPANTTNGRQVGGFIGYNWQWEQVVLGMDLAYNRMASVSTSASDTLARQVVTSPDNVNNSLTITAQSSLKLIDYATLRARAGYPIGQFMPYAMAGAAVGRFNYANTATVHNVGTPPQGSAILPFDVTDTQSQAKDNAITGGFVVGLGMDVALLPNVFLRGEWEYIGFATIGGISASTNTGRVAIGMRF